MSKNKFISHKALIKNLEKVLSGELKVKVINKDLKQDLKNIVNAEVIKHARKEAMFILKQANRNELGEFLYYYHSRSVVLCSVIDSIKDRLVGEGVLVQGDDDNFGLIYREEFLKDNDE